MIDKVRDSLEVAEKGVNDAAAIGISTGIRLIISLLKEACLHNKILRDETLTFLLNTLSKVKPLGLWGEDYIDRVLDNSLDNVVTFLEEQVLTTGTTDESKAKAFKVLFSLGLLRGSLSNLLCVVELLRNSTFPVNYQREINVLME